MCSIEELKRQERYRKIEQIGKGAFSRVYRVLDIHTGTEYALKELCLLRKENVKKEVEMLRMLQHEGVPFLRDYFVTDNALCIVMDLVDGITLEEYVKQKGVLEIKEAKRIACEICEILKYMHTRPIPVIHGDIKPQNILVSSEGIRLVDLGGAFCQFDKTQQLYGTWGYLAPEMKEGKICPQSDVYAVGKVIIYMLTGCQDWTDKQFGIKEWRRYSIPISFGKIIKKCIAKEPWERYPNAGEVKRNMEEQKGYFLGAFETLHRNLGEIIRVVGTCIELYGLHMQQFGLDAGKIFFMGMYIIGGAYLFDYFFARSCRNVILDCECSLLVTNRHL